MADLSDLTARDRQARIHELILSGQSVPTGGSSFVPDGTLLALDGGLGDTLPDDGALVASRSHSSSHSSRTPPSTRRSGSPSRSSGSRKARAAAAAAAAAAAEADSTRGVDLNFQKEVVMAPPSLADRPMASSTLAQQLQLARAGLDDSNFPRAASMAPHRFTVYLPHEEGSMVQIEVSATCTAHNLVKAALSCAKQENGGEMPSGLLDDPWAYRVHVAEEDGEIDDDYPACDVRLNICTLGADTFCLRDRVDARGEPGTHGRTQPSGSVVLGPGREHNDSKSGKASSAFASLETDTSFDAEDGKKKEAQQTSCCAGCVVQ